MIPFLLMDPTDAAAIKSIAGIVCVTQLSQQEWREGPHKLLDCSQEVSLTLADVSRDANTKLDYLCILCDCTEYLCWIRRWSPISLWVF